MPQRVKSTVVARVSEPPRASAREATSLARELGRAREEVIKSYERNLGISRQEALEKTAESETDSYARWVLSQPVMQTSWADLDLLAATDPELASERWEKMIEVASDELATGHRSAIAIEGGSSDPFERARFVALTHELECEWAPQNGIERFLIDSMAQAASMKHFWLKRMVALDGIAQNDTKEGTLAPPRVSSYHAIEQAAAMVDRFDRVFMRELRQLRDLRRYVRDIVVEHADQINFAEQQVNVAQKQKSRNVAKRRKRTEPRK